MRAIVLREFGPPGNLVATDVPEPQPSAGQVLVEVAYANVTFVETQIRAGRPPNPAMAPRLPAILGNGVGGVAQGRRVVTTTGGSGGYAERVAVDEANLIEVPAELTLAYATALLADGRTALSLMQTADIQPGETVLVEAAAGGVGSLLVQLARNAGARVVAAAGGARKVEVARSLGAHAVVDYTRDGWPAEIDAVDLVFDGIGGAIASEAAKLVRPGGRFLPFGMASGAFARVDRDDVTVLRGGPLAPDRSKALSEQALAEAAAGRLEPLVGQTVALERAADAHAAIESRATIGKTLLAASS